MTENMEFENTQQNKFKEYGKKSLAPMADLAYKYKGDINPYMTAIGKGLQAAVDSFNQSLAESGVDQGASQNNEAEKLVSGFFRDTQDWFNRVQQNLESKNSGDLLTFLESQGRLRPIIMFSSSYVVGLLFGRLGRHMYRVKSSSTDSMDMDDSLSNDSSLGNTGSFDPNAGSDQIH
jgi:hypothetical protein